MPLICACLLLVFTCLGLSAQNPPARAPGPVSSSPIITSNQITTHLTATTNNIALDASTKASVETLSNQSLEFLQDSAKYKTEREQFEIELQNAPALTQTIRTALQAPSVTNLLATLSTNLTSAQLEQKITQTQIELEAAKKREEELRNEPKKRTGELGEIAQSRSNASTALLETQQDLQALQTSPQETPALTVAQRYLLQAQIEAYTQEISLYDTKQKFYTSTDDLLKARLDQATRQANQLSQLLDAYKNLHTATLNQESQRAAQLAEEDRKRLLSTQYPILQFLADTNAILTSFRIQTNQPSPGPLHLIATTRKNLNTVERELKAVAESSAKTLTRIQSVQSTGMGISDAIGVILRRERLNLTKTRQYQADLRQLNREMSQAQKDWFGFDDWLNTEPSDVQVHKDLLLSSIQLPENEWERLYLENKTEELLTARRKYLTELTSDYSAYFDLFTRLNQSYGDLIQQTQDYANFIDERVLWIRSTSRLTWKSTVDEWTTIRDILSFPHLKAIGGILLRDFLDNHLLYLPFAILWSILLYHQKTLRKRLNDWGEQAKKIQLKTQYSLTLRSLTDTLLLSLPGPLLLGWFSWRLTSSVDASDLTRSTGNALLQSSYLYYSLNFARQSCQENGLAIAHFSWPSPLISLIHKHLRWLIPVGVLPHFFVHLILEETRQPSTGRLIFFLSMAGITAFCYFIFHPENGFLNRIRRLPTLWFLLILGAPISLALLAAWGYYYTSLQITTRLQYTLWLFFASLLLYALVARWFLIVRRRLAFEQAKKRREAQRQSTDGTLPKDVVTPTINDDPMIDVSEVEEQTKRLLRTAFWISILVGAWNIWGDILPAINALNRVPVLSSSSASLIATSPVTAPTANNPTPGAASTANSSTPSTATSTPIPSILPSTSSPPAEPTPAPSGTPLQKLITPSGLDPGNDTVTWGKVILALMTLLIMTVASHNIPGLLEMTLLRRLDLQPGGGYAITTVVRYAITLLGILLAFSLLGLTWSKVQWLAAAVTVGIGFGLQEIFANFVSGLIILFERPIRVGDVVTVNNISGKVSRIQMRATTIVDWDNKELLVPNKELITSQVVNWTLTDPITRVVFQVGIAYGSNVQLANDLLLRIAEAHPLVLKNPAPTVVFQSFGESSLDFILRVFIGSLDHHIPVRHDINCSIDAQFKKAGIEIAFPQRDLHIRSLPPEWAPPNFISPPSTT